MRNVTMDDIGMTLDVMKFALGRVTAVNPVLGCPKEEKELKRLVGETITPEGIGGEKAFQLFKEILVPATVSIDHP